MDEKESERRTRAVDALLAGIHLIVACEAVAFARSLGIDIGLLYDLVVGSPANSSVWEALVPKVLNGSAPAASTIADELTSLSSALVLARSPRFRFNATLASSAEQTLVHALRLSNASTASSRLVDLVWGPAGASERNEGAGDEVDDDAATLDDSEVDAGSAVGVPPPITTKDSFEHEASFSTPTDRLSGPFSSIVAAGETEQADEEDDDSGSYTSATSQTDTTSSSDFSLDSVPAPPPLPSALLSSSDTVRPDSARASPVASPVDYFSHRRRSKGKAPATTPGALLRQGSTKLAWVGLGPHGSAMGLYLAQAGFWIQGWDPVHERRRRFALRGGDAVETIAEVVEDAEVVAFVGLDADQVSDLLVEAGMVGSSPTQTSSASPSATIIVFSTLPPASARGIASLLEDTDHELIDAPIAGSVFKASRGSLSILASQSPSSSHTSLVLPVLKALTEGGATDPSGDVRLRFVPGGVGTANAVKSVLCLLGGCHILAAAEAISFAVRLGLSPRAVYDRILSDPSFKGASRKLEDRDERMLMDERHPGNPLSDYLRDLTVVVEEARKAQCPVWMASTTLQSFLLAGAAGWGGEDDSSVVRLVGKVTGESVARATKERGGAPPRKEALPPSRQHKSPPAVLKRAEVEGTLPPPWEGDANGMIRGALQHAEAPILVVILDSLADASSLHGLEVYFVWDVETLVGAFRHASIKAFCVLADYRDLPSTGAEQLIHTITANAAEAAKQAEASFEIVLCGDGRHGSEHLPGDCDTVEEVIGRPAALIVSPFLPSKGRLVHEDVAYTVEGDDLVPACDLHAWIDNALGPARVRPDQVVSISLRLLRSGSPQRVAGTLEKLPRGCVIIVNALARQDMDVWAAGLLVSQQKTSHKYLFRCAAGLVASRLGLDPIASVQPEQQLVWKAEGQRRGGLLLMGVEAEAARQLVDALSDNDSSRARFDLCDKLGRQSPTEASLGLETAVATTDNALEGGHNVLLACEGAIGRRRALEIMGALRMRPRFILSSGDDFSVMTSILTLGASSASIVGEALGGGSVIKVLDPHGVETLLVDLPTVDEDTSGSVSEEVKRWAAQQ